MDLYAKTVNSFLKNILALLMTASIISCQKSSDTSQAIEASSQALNCHSSQLKSSSDDMKLEGTALADVGQVVQYKLNQDALCSGAEKVQWSAPGAEQISSQNGLLAAKYNSPGNYYVAAKLVGSTTSASDLVQKTLVVGNQVLFTGPQIAIQYAENTFSITTPAQITLTQVIWDFGDGQTQTTTSNSVVHSYSALGEYLIKVSATDQLGVTTTIEHFISVIPISDELFCAVQVLISGASETQVGVNNTFSAFLPACLTPYIINTHWEFGDSTNADGNPIDKAYSQTGDYLIKATIQLSHFSLNKITVTKNIQVNPAIIDNNKCTTLGQVRETLSAPYIQVESCGIDGHKNVTYQDRRQESCQRVNEILDWTLTSQSQEKLNEGPCEGQACPLPAAPPSEHLSLLKLINGQYFLPHNTSLTFYTQQQPINSCEASKETRSCSNGTLSGSSQAIYYQCQSGCGDFGPNGTQQLDIIVGTRQVPLQCSFGELGIYDVYNELEDRSCMNGSIISSEKRIGQLISKGQCPTYSYVASGNYTACSENCGGTQSMIYECRNTISHQLVSDSYCAGQEKPSQYRICDGNPEAVRRVETLTQEETKNGGTCPSHQIGIITQTRTVTTKNSYACIEHQVAIENTSTDYTPWVEEKYCRNYVAYRCSKDSLNNTQAHGRFQWMQKCAAESPIIAEFLENFDTISKNNINIETSTRVLYPTFMDSSSKPEKPWIAPTTASASCQIPASVYIAAVCVSSCAIPQEKIIAQMDLDSKISHIEFVEALEKNYQRVLTLSEKSELTSRPTELKKVDQWITELVDTEQPILTFRMESGGVLSVTPNHPLLRIDGSMGIASDFKQGDSLVKMGGRPDRIISIEKHNYFGKVYNLFVKSSIPQENIVVTNGYLNGSAFFQNEGAQYTNQKILRQRLTRGVFK